ncbi:MAG: hypothetical protein M3Y87_17515 [Myxococcota bacterium]|nr:hypothetical protein [Myxococcota bacterium]
MLPFRIAPLAALVLLAACETSLTRTGSDAGARVDGPIAGECTARYAVARRLPEVVLVLDRSCAMRGAFAGGDASGPADPGGRWDAMRAALDARLVAGSASWGLVLAPDEPTSCEAPLLRTAPGPGSREAIGETLAQDGVVDPFALCPSGSGVEVPLEGALATLADADPFTVEGPLVLIIAAGTPTCGATTDSLAAEVAGLVDLGVDIAVLALSPDPTLRAIADAAGGHGSYQEATSAAEVDAALDAILDARASCVLDLVGSPTPDPERLRVWIDGVELPADPEEGFSFDASDAITLNGSACTRLREGAITRIGAAVGCDAPACVPRGETCDGLDDDCDDRVDEDCL